MASNGGDKNILPCSSSQAEVPQCERKSHSGTDLIRSVAAIGLDAEERFRFCPTQRAAVLNS